MLHFNLTIVDVFLFVTLHYFSFTAQNAFYLTNVRFSAFFQIQKQTVIPKVCGVTAIAPNAQAQGTCVGRREAVAAIANSRLLDAFTMPDMDAYTIWLTREYILCAVEQDQSLKPYNLPGDEDYVLNGHVKFAR